MSSGHGISDAVRKSIGDWMTNKVVDILHKEAMARGISDLSSKYSFRSRLRSESQWKRISRSKSAKAGVWQRTYYSKLFGGKGASLAGVGLTVLTNKGTPLKQEDMYIEYVTITFAGKVIGGGKVSIPSLQLSQKGRKASLEEFASDSLFSEFSEEQLAELTAQLEFGEDSVFALIEEERYA